MSVYFVLNKWLCLQCLGKQHIDIKHRVFLVSVQNWVEVNCLFMISQNKFLFFFNHCFSTEESCILFKEYLSINMIFFFPPCMCGNKNVSICKEHKTYIQIYCIQCTYMFCNTVLYMKNVTYLTNLAVIILSIRSICFVFQYISHVKCFSH